MKVIYAKALERSFQLFFLMVFYEFILGSICVLLLYLGCDFIGIIIAHLCSYSLFAWLLIIPTPLIFAKLFEKQKTRENKYSDRKELSNQRHINRSPFVTIIIEFIERLKLDTNRCAQSENSNNTQYTCYKPEISHLIAPFMDISKRIIKRLATKCKQNPCLRLLSPIADYGIIT